MEKAKKGSIDVGLWAQRRPGPPGDYPANWGTCLRVVPPQCGQAEHVSGALFRVLMPLLPIVPATWGEGSPGREAKRSQGWKLAAVHVPGHLPQL